MAGASVTAVDRQRQISGSLTHGAGGSVSNLDVEVWFQRGGATTFKRFLSRSRTDSGGKFTVSLPADDRQVERALERARGLAGRLEVKVFREERPMVFPQGQGSVVWSTTKQPYGVSATVTEPAGGPTANWEVMGVLYRSDRTPVGATTVKVFQKQLNGDVQLALVATGGDGRFVASFASPGAEADLYVRAEGVGGVRLATSAVHYRVTSYLRVDLRLADATVQGASDWEILDDEVTALLPGGTTADGLDAPNALYLASKLDEDQVKVSNFLAAKRLAAAHTTSNLTGPVYYALLSQGLPGALGALSSVPAPRIASALTAAVKAKAAPGTVDDAPASVSTDLAAWRTTQMLSTSRPGSLGALLATTALPAGKHDDFLDRWRTRTGTAEDFWTDLASDSDTDLASNAAEIRKKLFTGRLVLNHAPMVKAIEQVHGVAYTSARYLAQLSQANWETLVDTVVDGSPAGWPDGVQGANDTEKKQNYATMLRQRVEAAFATARVKVDAAAAGSGWTDVSTFLTNNPTFDFERTHIDAGWSGFTTSGLTDAAATKLQLKAAQRVYRLVPEASRFAGVKVLLDAGLDSAVKIEKLRMSQFVTQFTSAFGSAGAARTVYQRASQQAARAMAVFGVHNPRVQGPAVAAIPSIAEAVAADASLVSGVPDYLNIFGTSGGCECMSCESILSPGAYMVDILSYVQGFGGEATLQARREDLYDLKLTCPNNDTSLPYIDLVNEILEDRIAVLDGKARVDFSETTWTAAELRATPEHRNDLVYDEVLSTAIFPFRLPFSLGLAESRVFLDHLGISRYHLMELVPEGGSLAATDEVAAERLSLSPEQWSLVIGTDAASGASEWWKHWGFATAAGNANPRPGTTGTVDWDNVLWYVPEFCKRSGLSLEEVKDLLHVRFKDISTNLALSDTCDYDALEFVKTSSLTQPQWETWFRDTASPIMRFIRTWRAMGCSMLDLDRALFAFGATSLDAVTATKLGLLLRLVDFSGRPLAELLPWFGLLDTRKGREIEEVTEPSYYDRLFQNPTMEAEDPSWNRSVLEALALNALRTDLEHSGLYALASVDNTTQPEQSAVTSAILSAMRIDFADLDLLKTRVTSLGTTVTLASLSGVARHVSLARAWKMSIEETLDFLQMTGVAPFAPVAGAIAAMVEREAHKAGPFTTQQLYWLLGHDVDATELEGPSKEAMSEILFGVHTALVAGDADTRPEILRTRLAEALGLDVAVMEVLLERTAPNLSAGAELSAEAQFYTTTFLTTTSVTEPTDAPTQYDTLLRLHKVATVLLALDLDSDETTWLLDRYATWLLLTLVLPVSGTTPATLYPGWAALRTLFAQRAQLPEDVTPTFYELLTHVDTSTESTFKSALATRSGWESADVDYLAGADGFNLTFPAGWRSAENWRKFFDAMATTTRLGMAAKQVSSWAAPGAGTAEAADIRLAARSKHEEADWLETVAPLQDKLRTQQRDALADYLAQRDPDVDEREDLYADLLIDVETSWCMLTSRMRQGLCSVQLFVHRCLLAQEGITLTSSQTDQWEWMKTYRVWEAAVKIFLWPENWIEPDLRMDSSPEFKTFARSLLSADLSAATAESAYLTYLDTVNVFSKPEVLAFVHDKRDDADGSVDVLYVFARTRTSPARYLWRRREDGIRWTPWEELGVSVDSDHLIPVIYHGRLYLFWPSLEESAEDGYDSLRLSWNVGMNYAERRHDEWRLCGSSPEELAVMLQITNNNSPRLLSATEDDFTFRAREESASLYIDVYVHNVTNGVDSSMTRVGAFVLGGCDETLKVAKLLDLVRLFDSEQSIPADTVAQRQTFEKEEGGSLFVPVTGEAAYTDQPELLDNVQVDAWRLVIPANDITFHADETELFLVDDARAYLIIPLEDCPDEPEQNENSFNLGRLVDPRKAGNFVPPSTAPTIPVTTVDIEFQALTGLSLTQDTKQDALGPMRRKGRVKSSFTEETLGAIPLSTTVENTTTERIRNDSQFSLEVSGDTLAAQSQVNRTLTIASDLGGDLMKEISESPRFLFQAFYHPFTCAFLGQVRRFGVGGLLAPEPDGEYADLIQQASVNPDVFTDTYDPTSEVTTPYPEEDIDFSYGGTYSLYNWEIFFHGPMLVADRLRTGLRFTEARSWLHYVFDPTRDAGGGAPDGWWRIKPFTASAEDVIGELEAILLGNTDDAEGHAARIQSLLQVVTWRNDPFDPHKIAAIRTRAYQVWTLMRYLDNLIAWGDELFRQDTIEAINEATNLYVLALDLLGDKPKFLESEASLSAMSVSDVLDSVSETRLDKIEGLLATPCMTGPFANGLGLGVLRLFGTFCAPPNPKLIAYWETLEDRLFKIRNCMNISGEVRALPIWDPPIDPALLVKANALGWSLATILSGLTVAKPNYRFSFMIQRAYAYCASVRSLGAALLTAYEKRDTEQLARLRAEHEDSIFALLLDIRQFQIDEATATLKSLNALEAVVQARADYYTNLIEAGDSRPEGQFTGNVGVEGGLNTEEGEQLDALGSAKAAGERAAFHQWLGSLASLLPDNGISVGAETSYSVTWGGSNVGSYYRLWSLVHSKSANTAQNNAQQHALSGLYARRLDEWSFQRDSATRELDQVRAQIDATEARGSAAQQELELTLRQRENNDGIRAHLEGKFASQELYDWDISEVASLYFKAYQLAVYVAVQTQQCWRREIGANDTFVDSMSHWDSAKEGLLAGEKLQLQLEQMEAAYLEQDDRELELTKSVRLSMLDPVALTQLRESRLCNFSIPEVLFDLDGPGHYMRRLKTVSVTVSHAGGIEGIVPMELTLTAAQVRVVERLVDYGREDDADGVYGDFVDNEYLGDVIALSHGRSDSGLFTTSLRDERYLPFERAGAISDWALSIPSENPPLLPRDISDVELHLKYTARQGTVDFQGVVNQHLLALADEGVLSWNKTSLVTYDSRHVHFIRASHDFPDAWAAFKATSTGVPTLSVELLDSQKPPALENTDLYVARAWACLSVSGVVSPRFEVDLKLYFGAPFKTLALLAATTFDGQPVGEDDYVIGDRPLATALSQISLNLTDLLDLADLEEIIIALEWVKSP